MDQGEVGLGKEGKALAQQGEPWVVSGVMKVEEELVALAHELLPVPALCPWRHEQLKGLHNLGIIEVQDHYRWHLC